MKNKSRLTQPDLNRIVKRVIKEQEEQDGFNTPAEKRLERQLIKEFKNRVMFEISREGGSLSDVVDSIRDVCDLYDS